MSLAVRKCQATTEGEFGKAPQGLQEPIGHSPGAEII